MEDLSLSGTIIDLEIRTFAAEEETWYNTTRVQITFEAGTEPFVGVNY